MFKTRRRWGVRSLLAAVICSGPGGRRRCTGALCLSLALAVPAAPAGQPASSPPPASTSENLPAAAEVVVRSIEALGGAAAIRRYSSRHVKGRFELPGQGVRGSLELFAARPDRMRLQISVPGLGDMATGYDGRVAWVLNPMTGPMVLDGQQLEHTRYDADFYAVLNHAERYASMETVGRIEFDGRLCYELRMVRQSGEEDTEFYDASTGLLAGSVVSRASPMGLVTATSIYADYKRIDGILLPTRVVQRLMGVEQVLTFTEIRHDAVDPSVFDLPAEIKALLDQG